MGILNRILMWVTVKIINYKITEIIKDKIIFILNRKVFKINYNIKIISIKCPLIKMKK